VRLAHCHEGAHLHRQEKNSFSNEVACLQVRPWLRPPECSLRPGYESWPECLGTLQRRLRESMKSRLIFIKERFIRFGVKVVDTL
jgi:hypothetical protein